MSLKDNEKALLGQLRSRIGSHDARNQVAEQYYQGTFTVKNLGIAVPPSLADIGTVSDWPATVVDIRHERLQFQGWLDGRSTNIQDIARQVNASVKVSEALLDSLVFGVGFLAVVPLPGAQVALHACSPRSASMLWDYSTDQAVAGLRTLRNATGELFEQLFLPGQVVTLEGDTVVARQYLPSIGSAVPMVRIRNRLRPRRFTGSSEISRAVMYYTDAAVRTMLGMEINREFYTTPQRYALNADMSIFGFEDGMSPTEKLELGWQIQAGKMLGMPAPEPGDPETKVGQFTPAPPTPYIEQIRTYSQLLASATGIPSAYLGFSTENPPSGDAIRAWTERLIRSVEGKQEIAGPDLHLLGWLLHRMSGGVFEWSQWQHIEEKWRDAATPTRASDADAAAKLVGAGILPGDSTVTWDRVGLTPVEQRRLEGERHRTAARDLAKRLREQQPPQPDPRAEDLASRRVPTADDVVDALRPDSTGQREESL